ncbi:uncharacterized protein PSFLO_07754 [Pseudozyma flocculosa]|uniref:Uncharacterized protein n=1 Tax=Pseudozyma flocculosa TaxID=84751 RepID=A0A5C3FFI7_9BASI|nr:uncharacterized protein PSFLO_07754 [Pseudozyma flocculosa]
MSYPSNTSDRDETSAAPALASCAGVLKDPAKSVRALVPWYSPDCRPTCGNPCPARWHRIAARLCRQPEAIKGQHLPWPLAQVSSKIQRNPSVLWCLGIPLTAGPPVVIPAQPGGTGSPPGCAGNPRPSRGRCVQSFSAIRLLMAEILHFPLPSGPSTKAKSRQIAPPSCQGLPAAGFQLELGPARRPGVQGCPGAPLGLEKCQKKQLALYELPFKHVGSR